MTCRGHAAELEQFAQDNQEIVQVIGVGSQQSFEATQGFLADTGITELPMLWERTGALWRINNNGTNSALQLLSYDLSEKSSIIFFNDAGRQTVLDASPQQPWAP